jgi:aminomethyltransferase
MCTVRWTGKDAIDFVESVTTADIHGLKTGTGTLSVIPNEKGGIIDDTMVSKLHSSEHGEYVYQVINCGCAPKDLKHFDEHLGRFGGDVKMEVLWDSRGLYALQGPKAVDVMQRLCPSMDFKAMGFGVTLPMTLEGAGNAECLVTRCGYTGEDGFEIYVPEDLAVTVWRLLRDAPETRLAALGARDALRLEAGLCLYGHDLDEDTTPIEGGLAWVVGKARRAPGAKPFVGSERILGQIADKSQYTKLRAGLLPLSGPPAREGAAIETPEGVQVGTVTSGTMSPTLRKNVAMGFIDKPFNKQGTELNVVVRNKKYPAVVSKMPFVPTKYYKP